MLNLRKNSKNFAWSKPRIKSLYFDPNNFSFENFASVILNNFKTGVSYSLLFKLKYLDNDGVQYGMASKQRPFKLPNSNVEESIKILYDDITNLFDIFMDRYNVDDVELIQVLYIVIKDIPELKLKNINSIKLNKTFTKIKETRIKFSSKSLPLTTDVKYYGKLLLEDKALFYLNIINEYNNTDYDISNIDSIYLYLDTFIIINEILDSKLYKRNVFSAKSGMLYLSALDNIIDSNSFTRTINKTTTLISNGKVARISSTKELKPMKHYQDVYKSSSNPFIGTLDLETYVDSDGYSKVYALGFYTKIEVDKGSIPNIFYLNNKISSSELVLKCIDSMLISKYNNYTFYAHNLGGFDSIFILNILKTANVNLGFDYYKMKYTFRDNKLLKLEIKVEIDSNTSKESGFYKITILDSYTLLRGNLYDLSRAFKLNTVKGYFPHKFVNIDTINYVGNTPSKEYWNDITIEEYNSLFKNSWSLKDECIKYLNKDLISLYNIMDIFNKFVYKEYGVQMTECLTISRLALNIFLKKYLNDSKIPLIPESIYNDIKKAYYGGVTEVYKPYGENLYYYDVNSLYPYAALNPMPGLECTYVDNIKPDVFNKDSFGFYYCEIESPNNYLGLLPVHSKFELTMPNGKWVGWYFSEELKLAANNGYIIKVIKGYSFNKSLNVFDKYVKDLYELKATSQGSIKAIAKSLLNNLLGRLGLNIKKPISEIVDDNKLDLIHSTREVLSTINVTDKDYLITYYPSISKSICDWYDLDYINLINQNSKDMETEKEFKDTSIAIAAAVTSYSRVHMSKIKLDILNSGGSIYYTDTDSIVTDIPLNEFLVGKKLGQFKLEHEVLKGYFISSKTYCLVICDGKGVGFIMISIIIKAKGLNSNSLTLNDFVNMYKGIDVKGLKNNTKVSYDKGSVVIDKKSVKLDHNSYRKREKIFKNSKWVDTRPLSYNNINVYNVNTLKGKRNYNSLNYINSINNFRLLSKFKELKEIFIRNKLSLILSLLSISLISYLLYKYIPNFIDNLNSLYANYLEEVNKIKVNHTRYVLENRLSNFNRIENIKIEYTKLSKFIDINTGWISHVNSNEPIKYSITEYFKNISKIDFSSITSIYNSPILEKGATLSNYVFEARPIHPSNINPTNPLGIQGVDPRILDDTIDLLNNYISEHKKQSLEILNYQSNILYILINNLTPITPVTR